jgi:ParB family chromosome partitioning protein
LVDDIKLSEVKIPEGRFRTSLGDLDSLKESIKRVGLLHPIGITDENVLVYGFRRLHAARALGWKKVPYVRVTLDGALRRLAELEENSKRKDWKWQEEVKATSELHELCQKLHGMPKQGFRGDLMGPVKDSEKGWGLKETAEFLNESIGLVSQDIKLAKALEEHPHLWKERNKSNALRRLDRIEHPEKYTPKGWECSICGTEFVGTEEKSKLDVCSLCYAQVSFNLQRLKAETRRTTEEKPMTLRDWLGTDSGLIDGKRLEQTKKEATTISVS